MKRPMLYALAFLLAGILAGSYADTRMALFCAPVLGLLIFCLYKAYRYKPVLLFALFALLGFWRAGGFSTLAPLPSGTVTLYGVAEDSGYTASGRVKLVVKTDSLRVLVYTQAETLIDIGREVSLIGTLQPLRTATYPGAYDEAHALGARKIHAIMFPDEVTLGERRTTLASVRYAASSRMAVIFHQVLPPQEAALMRSILLGDTGGLGEDIKEVYRVMGIYHILAISGLHVAVLMLAVKRFMQLFMRERAAIWVALIVMVGYGYLTGGAVSTVRALTMCAVSVGAKAWFREYDLPASISFAAILLLVYEPLYLYDVSFQLSFSAVAGIALLTQPLEYALTRVRFPVRRLKSSLASCLAATLATYPVLCFHFYEISIYSVLANMLVVPTVVVLVVIGAIVGLAGLIWLPAAAFLSGVLFYLLRFYEALGKIFTRLPFALWRTGGCGLAVLLAAFALMAVCALRPKPRPVVAAAAVFTATVLLQFYPPGLTVMVFNDAAVLRQHRRAWVVSDAETYDAGRYLEYISLPVSETLHGPARSTLGDTSIAFNSDKPAEVWVLDGKKLPEVFHTQAVIINGGNRWRRTALTDAAKKAGLTVYDTADGAVRLHMNGRTVRIYHP